jgi:hypothetical protein
MELGQTLHLVRLLKIFPERKSWWSEWLVVVQLKGYGAAIVVDHELLQLEEFVEWSRFAGLGKAKSG